MVSINLPGKPALDPQNSLEAPSEQGTKHEVQYNSPVHRADYPLDEIAVLGRPKRKADRDSPDRDARATPSESNKRVRLNALPPRETPTHRAVDRFGSVQSDLVCFEPGKLIGKRVFKNTGQTSIEFRLAQVTLAIEIEMLKKKEKQVSTTSELMSESLDAPILLTLAESAVLSKSRPSASEALVKLQTLHAEATTPRSGEIEPRPVRDLARACATNVSDAVTINTLNSLSARVEIEQSGNMLQVQQFSLDNKFEALSIKDQPSTVFVLNGNNDEGYIRALGKRLKHFEHVTIVVSGFGGHGTTDQFAVRTDKTEADRFAEILSEVGVKGKIIVEPFSTNSGENAQYVGELLSTRMLGEPARLIVCGTPAAVLRQTLTYVAQIPRKRNQLIVFTAGPQIPLDGYITGADKLLALRECFTLFSYLHNTAYLPRVDSFSNSEKYISMLKTVSVEPLAAIKKFRNTIISQVNVAGDDPFMRKLFSDPHGSYSLHDVMNNLSFIEKPDFLARICDVEQISIHEKLAMNRAHGALGKMFEEIETGIARSHWADATM